MAGRVCTVCAHDDREAIEDEILKGESRRAIAGQFALDDNAVDRHRDNCMKTQIEVASSVGAVAYVASGADLVAKLHHLHDEALRFLERARQADDLKAAAPLIGQAINAIKVQGQFMGLAGPTNQVNTQINVGQSAVPPPPWYLAATRGAAKADETLARWLLDAGGGDSFDECAENARRNLDDAVGRWLPRRG